MKRITENRVGRDSPLWTASPANERGIILQTAPEYRGRGEKRLRQSRNIQQTMENKER
jgi:hypothetical protein